MSLARYIGQSRKLRGLAIEKLGAETALRMNFNDSEVSHLHELVIEKNRKRGYYDER